MAARKGVADASPVVAGAAAEPYPALQQPTVRLDGTNDPPCVPFCAPAEARRRESEEFPTQRSSSPGESTVVGSKFVVSG